MIGVNIGPRKKLIPSRLRANFVDIAQRRHTIAGVAIRLEVIARNPAAAN
jgi:hypothetical protein